MEPMELTMGLRGSCGSLGVQRKHGCWSTVGYSFLWNSAVIDIIFLPFKSFNTFTSSLLNFLVGSLFNGLFSCHIAAVAPSLHIHFYLTPLWPCLYGLIFLEVLDTLSFLFWDVMGLESFLSRMLNTLALSLLPLPLESNPVVATSVAVMMSTTGTSFLFGAQQSSDLS